MTEEWFKDIPLESLPGLLVNCTKEYKDAIANNADPIKIEVKKEEVELLQRAIVAKDQNSRPAD